MPTTVRLVLCAVVVAMNAGVGVLACGTHVNVTPKYGSLGGALAECRQSASASPCCIHLDPCAGPFFVNETLTIGGVLSGLTIDSDFPSGSVPVCTDHSTQAVVSGSVLLSSVVSMSGWVPPSGQSKAWTLPLPAPAPVPPSSGGLLPASFHSLFVNGVRATRGRSPDFGSYHTMMGPTTDDAGNPDPSLGFCYAPGDISSADEGNQVVVFQSWQTTRRRIKSVNASSRCVEFTQPGRVEFEPNANSGSRFYVEGPQHVDAPGEWGLTDDGRSLLYVPLPGQSPPPHLTFNVPVVTGSLLHVSGSANVTISNVAWRHTDWDADLATTKSGSVQAASFLTSAGVHVTGSSGVVLSGVEVSHHGHYGVWFEGGSTDGGLVGSTVFDVGAGGVRIGRGKPLTVPAPPNRTSRITVSDSTIVDGGHVLPAGCGVLLQHASNNTIAYNEVGFFRHITVSVGWDWSYGPADGGNVVHGNYVHHAGRGVLSDFGLVYLLGESPGTAVTDNYLRVTTPYYVYGSGLYLDQATSFVTLSGNVVQATRSAPMHQHFGADNHVFGNVFGFAYGEDTGAVWQANIQPSTWGPSNFTFHRNVVAVQAGAVFQTPYHGGGTFDNNLYVNMTRDGVVGSVSATFPTDGDGDDHSCHASFDEWRTVQHQDAHSLVNVDPQFVDAVNGDLRVAPTSPAIKVLGFPGVNASMNSTGPREGHGPRPGLSLLPGCGGGGGGRSCPPPVQPSVGGVTHYGSLECGSAAVLDCGVGFAANGPTLQWCGEGGEWMPALPSSVSASVGTPGRCTRTSFIDYGGELGPGEFIVSPSNTWFFTPQTDGNLCLYRGSGPSHNDGPALWCAVPKPDGHPVYLVMQTDGNACLRRVADQSEVWCSMSNQPQPFTYYLDVRDEGRVCVSRGGRPDDNRGTLWCSPGGK